MLSPYLLLAEVWGLHQDVNELLSLRLPPTCSLLLSLYLFSLTISPSSLSPSLPTLCTGSTSLPAERFMWMMLGVLL